MKYQSKRSSQPYHIRRYSNDEIVAMLSGKKPSAQKTNTAIFIALGLLYSGLAIICIAASVAA